MNPQENRRPAETKTRLMTTRPPAPQPLLIGRLLRLVLLLALGTVGVWGCSSTPGDPASDAADSAEGSDVVASPDTREGHEEVDEAEHEGA